jgi:conjugative transfer region protein TrbK
MIRVIVWGAALVMLLTAAVLAGRAVEPSSPARAAKEARDPELARCQALGEAGGQDARCQAAWASARARFFGAAAS